MRYLITGLLARAGWLPSCACHDAVTASAQAHHQTMRELEDERALTARLTADINAMASEGHRLDEELSRADEKIQDLEEALEAAQNRTIPAPRQGQEVNV